MEQKLEIKTRKKHTMMTHHKINTTELQKQSKSRWNTTYMKYGFRDKNIKDNTPIRTQ